MKRALIIALLLLTGSAFADSPYPSTSIYQLSARLTNQAGAEHGLDVYKGHPVLVTMFYGSCAHTCPLLIETVRAVERAAPDAKNLRVLMISIDPERDTVAALAKIAKERRIDTTRWTLARTDAQTVRKIAALLNVQYKQSPNGEINHSSVITVVTPDGDIARQSSMLGKADEELVSALNLARGR
jgi:protein SCO1/2